MTSEISPALSQRISELILDYLADPLSPHRDLAEATRALPVYSDMGGTLLLTPGGEILMRAHDTDEPPAPESSPCWRLIALVRASERHPELAALLPRRPADAPACAECGGAGHVFNSAICGACFGLGWRGAA